MTSRGLGYELTFLSRLCAPLLKFAVLLKAQTYCPRSERLALRSSRCEQSRLGQLFKGKLVVGIDADPGSHPHRLFGDESSIQLRVLDQDTRRRQSEVST